MLLGRKVKLRPKKLDDAFRDYTWSRDPDLARLDATYPYPLSFSEYYQLYAATLENPAPSLHHFAIDTLEGKHIGNCVLYDVNQSQKEGELGIVIGDKKYWDQGYGTEAVQLLLNYAFASVKLRRIYLHTLTANHRAKRCFEKCGFTASGNLQTDSYSFLIMEFRQPIIKPEPG